MGITTRTHDYRVWVLRGTCDVHAQPLLINSYRNLCDYSISTAVHFEGLVIIMLLKERIDTGN